MSEAPAVYKSTHRIKFSDLDPYRHMRTTKTSAYYVDHRMDVLREQAGWDLQTLERLPFMTFVKRLESSSYDLSSATRKSPSRPGCASSSARKRTSSAP